LYRGEIPEKGIILHSCDNGPLCANPDHLTLGNQQDNADDKARKRRHARGAGHMTMEEQMVLRLLSEIGTPYLSALLNKERHIIGQQLSSPEKGVSSMVPWPMTQMKVLILWARSLDNAGLAECLNENRKGAQVTPIQAALIRDTFADDYYASKRQAVLDRLIA